MNNLPVAVRLAPKPRMSCIIRRMHIDKPDAEWRKELSPEQYHVLREAGTERPFGKAYEEFKQQGEGTYVCGGCGAELFSSKEKFDSHCGWPSFFDPANAKNVETREDASLGQIRTEVRCAMCGGHLGHVFRGEGYDTPTDLRYCINGVALKFRPAGPDLGRCDTRAQLEKSWRRKVSRD